MSDILDEFRAFVRSKPRNEAYDFYDINNCALAQFGRSRHPGEHITAGASYYRRHALAAAEQKVWIANYDVCKALQSCQTFGELADKLETIDA